MIASTFHYSHASLPPSAVCSPQIINHMLHVAAASGQGDSAPCTHHKWTSCRPLPPFHVSDRPPGSSSEHSVYAPCEGVVVKWELGTAASLLRPCVLARAICSRQRAQALRVVLPASAGKTHSDAVSRSVIHLFAYF